jgi:hypothetical protein
MHAMFIAVWTNFIAVVILSHPCVLHTKATSNILYDIITT